MDVKWEETFRRRMTRFRDQHVSGGDGIAVSIKVRVSGGCFHREHSPQAYQEIDRCLDKLTASEPPFGFEEHESGPEVLVYVALATAALTLSKSVIELVTEIIKARSRGIKRGDRPSEPLELIVRRIDGRKHLLEETVLRVGHGDQVDSQEIERRLNEALRRITEEEKEH